MARAIKADEAIPVAAAGFHRDDALPGVLAYKALKNLAELNRWQIGAGLANRRRLGERQAGRTKTQ
jgi:hypothetical protein